TTPQLVPFRILSREHAIHHAGVVPQRGYKAHAAEIEELERDLESRAQLCHRAAQDRKSTRLNSSHRTISYAVFCLKKKTNSKTDDAARPQQPRSMNKTSDREVRRTMVSVGQFRGFLVSHTVRYPLAVLNLTPLDLT